ncbi:transcriptional regulator, AraC family [Ruegeria halocynthiae]|uniref:Transcriptional regulator, AraC family n=1 Tax=Ruegeria halocynthiae TaxID=985054 RepID=A0A1H3A7W0_9RHOB|nr:helix-turn-helix transcriptional regulator [Ruegeria halocynthiae]SDX25713.1 transcriptional regulator, AraC family [Ruegeria halocynthiae]
MDSPGLISFPLPLATALLCGVLAMLAWRLDLGFRPANMLFSAFFGVGAVSSLLVGLRFGYGVEELIPLQRTLPLFLGPLLYLSFASLTVERHDVAKIVMMHLGAPFILIGLYLLLASDLRSLDWVISASYSYYCIALFILWRKGPDALSQARVDVTQTLSNWLLRGIGFLVFVLVLDSAIAIDFAVNKGANASMLISYGTVPLIFLLLATSITLPLMFSKANAVSNPAPVANTEDEEVVDLLQALMYEQQLFLDPNITVQRLAKRLSLPARTVSSAVNRTQGTNMSQYVNEFRLAHAARLLTQTDESVANIATQSGFLARSNFYRAFQRVYGQSPTEYRTLSNSKEKPSFDGHGSPRSKHSYST